MKKLLSILFVVLLLLMDVPAVNAADELEDDPSARTIKDEIIYNILIDRYNNGDQAPSDQVDIDDPYAYQGGDLQGITDNMQDIDSAGFTAISLSPVMENKSGGYHGYWVEDFFEVEDEFGDLDDLKKLIKKAHDYDIKVLLELDLNYMADTSPVVEEHPDWFKDTDVEPIDATAWLEDVVRFDQMNTDATDYLNEVADYWLEETEIDGYTLHAVDQMEPDFLQTITNRIKEKHPTFYLIGTTLQEDPVKENLIDIDAFDAVSNPAMHEAMNKAFSKVDEPVSDVFDTYAQTENEKSLLYLDNMNTARFSNNFADEGRTADTTWNLALGYLYFMPGIPMVFQGSEVPMYGPGYPENQYMVDFTSADPDLEKAFSKMASVRDQFPSLARGDVEQVATNEGMALFKRTYKNEIVYVAINNDSESRTVSIEGDELTDQVQLRGLLHDDTVRQNKDGKFLIGMERESVEVFTIRDNSGFNWGFIGFVIGMLVLFIVFVVVMSVRQRKREKTK